jgi:uncharacterized protein (DUF1330 family)
MAKAYWVVTYRSVKNPEAWKAYAKLAVPAIESAGGRFLARSNPAKTYEAGMNERVVLVEFPKPRPSRRLPRHSGLQGGAQGIGHRKRRSRYARRGRSSLASRAHSANG